MYICDAIYNTLFVIRLCLNCNALKSKNEDTLARDRYTQVDTIFYFHDSEDKSWRRNNIPRQKAAERVKTLQLRGGETPASSKRGNKSHIAADRRAIADFHSRPYIIIVNDTENVIMNSGVNCGRRVPACAFLR